MLLTVAKDRSDQLPGHPHLVQVEVQEKSTRCLATSLATTTTGCFDFKPAISTQLPAAAVFAATHAAKRRTQLLDVCSSLSV